MAPDQDTAELKAALQKAAKTIIAALEDASKLTVETYIFKVGAAEAANEDYKGKLVARTIMEIDGDTSGGLPVIDEAKGEVQQGLLDLHNQNVERAMKYRSELLKSAQDLVKDLIETFKTV